MNVDALLNLARQKVSGRTPGYIDVQKAVSAARQEVADMAIERLQTAMEIAILGAQSILRTTCQEYIEALYITEDMRIAIRDDKAYLETGYDQREMLDDMLNSAKAQTSKDGDRFIIVPIGQKPDSNIAAAIGKKTSELFSKGRRSGASSQKLTAMVSDMQGMVRNTKGAPYAPRNSDKKEFRTATDKQDPGTDWVHPGFQGVNQLEFINQQLRVDLEEGAVRVLEDVINGMRR